MLHVVHCVDTEGPLHESIAATFERLRAATGIELPPSPDILAKLQNRELDVAGREDEVAAFLSPRRLAYLSDWDEVEDMVAAVTAPEFRKRFADPQGNLYTFSWFIIDNVGYRDNPRRKALGFHAVWDRYMALLEGSRENDSFGWHFHAVPVGNDALQYNSSWTNNDYHEQSLARRLIERNWFPSLFRAGGNIVRNDLSFWLEQFVPFDWSRTAPRAGMGGPGEQEDWRGAPMTWRPYHPDFYDYRRPGAMRRWNFRCQEIDPAIGRLLDEDVEDAFRLVRGGETAILAFSTHDRRDMRPEIKAIWTQVKSASKSYPDVDWRFSNAHEAARDATGTDAAPAPVFTLRRHGDTFHVSSDQPLFGPQPFLAIEEEAGVFFRDNMTAEGVRDWAYRLSRPSATKRISVAGSNDAGHVGMVVIDV